MRISRIGAEVDAILCARYFPVPNHAFIVGKELAFASDQLLNVRAYVWFVCGQTPNLIEMAMIIQDIREDHGVPDRKGDLQCYPGLVFTCLAREMKYGCGEVQERLGDFSIGMSYCASGHLARKCAEFSPP
jgi:hypothetical protein